MSHTVVKNQDLTLESEWDNSWRFLCSQSIKSGKITQSWPAEIFSAKQLKNNSNKPEGNPGTPNTRKCVKGWENMLSIMNLFK